MKWKLKYLIPSVVASLVLIGSSAALASVDQNSNLSSKWRALKEVTENVYADSNYDELQEALEVIEEAKTRVSDFFGGLESEPVVILCGEEVLLEKLGKNHYNQKTISGTPYNYIAVSLEDLNVDEVAYEITYIELNKRLNEGRKWYTSLVPEWFEEGIALQNDRRFKDIQNQEAVGAWLQKNGQEGLIELIDKVNHGAAFDDVYFESKYSI